MTIVNSAFTVNGATPTDAVAVAAGSTVTLAVTNTTGINGVVWSVAGNDNSARVNPTIVASGNVGATASFVMPADIGDGLGQAYRIQCTASDGGSPPNRSTTFAVVGVANPAGLVPIGSGEQLDRNLTYGWTQAYNRALAGDLRALYAVSQQPIIAVGADPGWYVLGTFVMPRTASVKLDVIGSVSDASLTLTARVYCITAGSVGEVSGSRATIATLIDSDALSGAFAMSAGRLYQIQAEVTGNAGDSYFGYVRRAAPAGI